MATETPAGATEPAPQKKSNLVPILIVVGIVVVIAIAAGVYFLTRDSGGSKPEGLPANRTAQDFYKAWQSDDQAAAKKVATPGTVTQLFLVNKGDGQGMTFGGCSKVGEAQLPKECVFSRPGGQVTMTIQLVNGTRLVTRAEFERAGTTPTTTG